MTDTDPIDRLKIHSRLLRRTSESAINGTVINVSRDL